MALSDDIQKLYIAYFNRPADPAGLAYWVDIVAKNGGSTAAVAHAFSGSAEYQATYAGFDSAAIVNKVYQNLFGRPAEATGLQFWSAHLDNGTINLGNIVTAIFAGAQGSDSVAVANKAIAAAQFTASLQTPGQIAAFSTDRGIILATQWLNSAATPEGLVSALSDLGRVIGTIVSGPTVDGGSTPTDKITLISAGGTYDGVSGVKDVFKAAIVDLNGTTITGNAADSDILTLTTAGTVTINNGTTGGTIGNVKVLNLADGTNIVTYDTNAGFTHINGGSGDDTFVPATALLPLVIKGGGGTDTIVLPASYAATASGSAIFANNVTEIEKLRLTGVTNQTIDLQALGNYNDVTLDGGANGLTLLNLASGGKVALTGAGTALTIANAAFAGGANDIVNLSLSDASAAGVAFATTGITASGVETVNISVNDNQATPSGAFNNSLTWLGNSVETITIGGNAGLSLAADSTALTSVDASGITLGGFAWDAGALAGYATIKGSATGTNSVNLNAAMAGVSYTGGTGDENVVINGTIASTVHLGGGSNSLTISGATILGTYTGGADTDSLSFLSATPNISAATITGFENLTLASNAAVTLTLDQLRQFTGTIAAAGTETFNVTTAGTFTAVDNIERYNLANGTNNFTATDTTLSVTGGSGGDTINVTAHQVANLLTGIDGGGGSNTLNIGTTTTQAIDLSTTVTNIQTVNVADSTGAAAFTNLDGAGAILNYTKSTGDTTISLGGGGQTLNILGSSSSATKITGGTGIDYINLSLSGNGSDTIVATGPTMSNRTNIDVVNNFNASGTDYFKTGVQASNIGDLTITSADTSDFWASIAFILPAVLNNTSQAYLVTIMSGSAAGLYLFQNTGTNVYQVDDSDFFVQLTGNTGAIAASNLIA